MRSISTSSPARDRARTWGVTAVVSSIGILVSLPLVGQELAAGVVVLVVSSVLTYVSLAVHLAMKELSDAGAGTVSQHAQRLPLLATRVPAADLVEELGRLRRHDFCLVAASDGWKVVSTTVVVDSALSTTGDVELGAYARPARSVPGDLPLNRLPRPPYADEVWLVQGEDPPRAFTHDDLLRAVAMTDVQAVADPADIRPEPAQESVVDVTEPAAGPRRPEVSA